MNKVFKIFDLWFNLGENSYYWNSAVPALNGLNSGVVRSHQSAVLIRYHSNESNKTTKTVFYKFPLDIDRDVYPVHTIGLK